VRNEGAEDALRRLLLNHNRRYPQWGVEDLYKLLHQAAMGSEHAAPEESIARAWMERELSQLGPGPAEPIVDPIRPGGEVVRVHLRPFLDRGIDPQPLLEAFLQTARHHPSSISTLEITSREAIRAAADGLFPFTSAKLRAFLRDMSSQSYPAVHHSPKFESEYRPAYRVVARGFLPDGIAESSDATTTDG